MCSFTFRWKWAWDPPESFNHSDPPQFLFLHLSLSRLAFKKSQNRDWHFESPDPSLEKGINIGKVLIPVSKKALTILGSVLIFSWTFGSPSRSRRYFLRKLFSLNHSPKKDLSIGILQVKIPVSKNGLGYLKSWSQSRNRNYSCNPLVIPFHVITWNHLGTPPPPSPLIKCNTVIILENTTF